MRLLRTLQTQSFGISIIERSVGPHSWGSMDRRSMKLGTGATMGPTTAHAKFCRPSVRVNTPFYALKILTSGGRYQSGDRRRFPDYYSQNSTNQYPNIDWCWSRSRSRSSASCRVVLTICSQNTALWDESRNRPPTESTSQVAFSRVISFPYFTLNLSHL